MKIFLGVLALEIKENSVRNLHSKAKVMPSF